MNTSKNKHICKTPEPTFTFENMKIYSPDILIEGDIWYVVSTKEWQKFSSIKNSKISDQPENFNHIDNTDITDSNYTGLINPKTPDSNMHFIHKSDYDKLKKFCIFKYEFPRCVISRPSFGKDPSIKNNQRLKLETFPILVHMLILTTEKKIKFKQQIFSKRATLQKVYLSEDIIQNKNGKEDNTELYAASIQLKETSTLKEEYELCYGTLNGCDLNWLSKLLKNGIIINLAPMDNKRLLCEYAEENHLSILITEHKKVLTQLEKYFNNAEQKNSNLPNLPEDGKKIKFSIESNTPLIIPNPNDNHSATLSTIYSPNNDANQSLNQPKNESNNQSETVYSENNKDVDEIKTIRSDNNDLLVLPEINKTAPENDKMPLRSVLQQLKTDQYYSPQNKLDCNCASDKNNQPDFLPTEEIERIAKTHSITENEESQFKLNNDKTDESSTSSQKEELFMVDEKVEFFDSVWKVGTIIKIDSNPSNSDEIFYTIVTSDNKSFSDDSDDNKITWGNEEDNNVVVKRNKIAKIGTHLQEKSNTMKPFKTNVNTFFSPYEELPKKSRQKGLTGLQNLGHTCFMNSTIQCLSNAEALTEYFLSDRYQEDINYDNPLGWKGLIAQNYGQVMKDMWSGQHQAISPFALKSKIGQFAPRFSGFRQQDSSELLFFLLDGLHEDLNLIKKKPYTQNIVNTGQSEEELAQIAWDNHIKRNKSVIVSIFQGQIKSTVVCPSCKYVSVMFDPFLSLSLPLFSNEFRYLEILFVPKYSGNKTRCTKATLKVPRLGDIGTVKNIISERTQYSVEQLVIVEVYKNKIYRWFDDYQYISTIEEGDLIFVYVVSPFINCVTEKNNHDVNGEESEEEQTNKDVQCKPDEEQYLNVENNEEKEIEKDKNLKSDSKSSENESYADETIPNNINHKNIFASPANKIVKDNIKNNQKDNNDKETSKLHSTKSNLKIPTILENVKSDEGDIETNKPAENMLKGGNEEFSEENENNKNVEKNEITEENEDKSKQRKPPSMKLVSIEQYCTLKSLSGEEYKDETSIFGYPFIINIPAGVTISRSQILKNILLSMEIVLRRPIKLPDRLLVKKKKKNTPYFTRSEITEYIGDSLFIEEDDTPVTIRVIWSNPNDINFWPFENPDVYNQNQKTHDSVEEDNNKSLSISDCFDLYCKQETLTTENAWYCCQCKDHKKADKKLEIWRLPNICIIHLKRFQQSFNLSEKINSHVDFPLTGLDLTKWLADGAKPTSKGIVYDLFAVSNHYGFMGGGHYTSYCKNAVDGKWYNFDDMCVSDLEEQEKNIVTSSAYVLFYKKRGWSEGLLSKTLSSV